MDDGLENGNELEGDVMVTWYCLCGTWSFVYHGIDLLWWIRR